MAQQFTQPTTSSNSRPFSRQGFHSGNGLAKLHPNLRAVNSRDTTYFCSGCHQSFPKSECPIHTTPKRKYPTCPKCRTKYQIRASAHKKIKKPNT